MEIIYINNENFKSAINTLRSKTFGEEKQFHILYDNLSPEFKKYLLAEETQLSKDKFQIYCKKPTSSNDPLLKKYKHQLRFSGETVTAAIILNRIFEGKENKEKLLNDLDEFENRYILYLLESTAGSIKSLSKILYNIDKYVYSNYFKSLVIYNCYGLNCKISYMEKKNGK